MFLVGVGRYYADSRHQLEYQSLAPVDWAEEEFGAAGLGDVQRVKSRKAGQVPRQGQRPARAAELEIRLAQVTLKPPELKPELEN